MPALAKELIAAQTPIEQRVLLVKPNEFADHLVWRRAKLAKLTAETTPTDNAKKEITQLQNEIRTITTRAKQLQRDASLTNIEDVDIELKQINRQMDRLRQNGNDFEKKGLQIRRETLTRTREVLTAEGPTLTTFERKRWKKVETINGTPLPPNQWEQLSPRLIASPDANVNEHQECQWYIESQSDQRRKEIHALASQMKPIGNEVNVVVSMPAYKEGRNIYRTLENFASQVDRDGKPIDYKKTRIVIFDNCPAEKTHDETGAEVKRFMADHPEVQIDYIRGRMADGEPKSIGNIRNLETAAIIENVSLNRTSPSKDLIYVSNDADLPENGIKKTYLADIMEEFDKYPRMDALAGKIDFPETMMAQIPVQYAIRRLWQFMDLNIMVKKNHEPFLVGRNSAMRLKMLAAVGNYDPADHAGEDVEIGNKIKAVRSWDVAARRYDRTRRIGGSATVQEGNRVRYANHIVVDSDPRRDIIRLIGGESIKNQYSVFEKDQSVRGKHGYELTQIALDRGLGVFDKALFEKQAADFYYDAQSWKKWGGDEAFARAMGFMGVKYEVVNGKFHVTDTTRLEADIKKAQEIYLKKGTSTVPEAPKPIDPLIESNRPRLELFLNGSLSHVVPITEGRNNRVFRATLTGHDGKAREIVLRMSDKRVGKFETERWAMEQARKHGVPTPKVIVADSRGSTIPGWDIVASEFMTGKPALSQKEKNVGKLVNPALLPQVGKAIRGVHDTVITEGYGLLDATGKGTKPTWESHVAAPFATDRIRLIASKGVARLSDLEQAKQYMETHKNLLATAPRRLLHGDFGFGNMMAEGNQLTGLLDFESAMSGDPLWDLATIAVYDGNNMGGEKGMRSILEGYGNPHLLDSSENRIKFNLYKLSRITYALEWYAQRPNPDQASLTFFNTELKTTLASLSHEAEFHSEKVPTKPIERKKINELLKGRFDGAVDWFRNFYEKGLNPQDQEIFTAQEKYKQALPLATEAFISSRSQASKEKLYQFFRTDPNVSLSDRELKRQIDRLDALLSANPKSLDAKDITNPLLRFMLYARTRGTISRYTTEYANLGPEVDFKKVIAEMAKRKAEKGHAMVILDEGGTVDLGLQQIAERIQAKQPDVDLHLYSTAADNMANQFADCHRIPVTHKMADIHHLEETYPDKKFSLIVSQAAYKFFWDPMGAIVQSANALENGGWAFLGDIQENVSWNFNKLFIDENGQSINPIDVFDRMNGMNLGYEFHAAYHIDTSMGEPRRILTLAIHKKTSDDLNVPGYYAERTERTSESSWRSPIGYIIPSDNADRSKFTSYTPI